MTRLKWILLAVFVACSSTTAPTSLVVRVTLDSDFEVSSVTGLKIVVDGADGGSLGIAVAAPQSFSAGVLQYSTEASNEDADSANEFIVTFSQSPFPGASKVLDFRFDADWSDATTMEVRCTALLGTWKQEKATATTLDDGTPVRFVKGQSRVVACNIACRAGYSCVGSAGVPIPTLTSPASPANSNALRVLGAADPTSTVRLYAVAGCDGGVVGEGSGTLFATSGIEVTPVVDDSMTAYYARATDVAGNPSACSSTGVMYVEDSTAPAPPVLTATSPSGTANDNAPRLFGSAEALSGIRVYGNAACDGGLLATGTAAQLGADAGDDGGGIVVPVGEDTTTTLFATATDDAGNTSGCGTTSVTYIEDTYTRVPTGLRTVPASPADNNSPAILGNAEPGATVRVYAASDCTGAVAAQGTTEQFSDAGLALSVGDNTTTTFYARATDLVGNVSRCSSALAYVEDSVAPDAAVVLGTYPRSPANWRYPAVYGFAEAQSTVRIYAAAACDGGVVAEGTAEQFGDAGIVAAVGEGSTTTFYATAMDPLGHVSPCAAAGVAFTELPYGSLSGETIALGYGSGANGTHTCVVAGTGADGGALVCFGVNDDGQLGDGTFDASAVPVGVVSLDAGVAEVVAGAAHTCARTTLGAVLCWGRNSAGQLGAAVDAGMSATPVVVFDAGVMRLSAGTDHTCAVTDDGGVVCWGVNSTGMLGDGTTTSRATPVNAAGLTSGAEIVAAGTDHTCAVTGAAVRCWGANAFGQLGNGTKDASATPVVATAIAEPVIAIRSGNGFSCALTGRGAVQCWGRNDRFQLGIDGGVTTAVVAQTLGEAAMGIGIGVAHACAILDGGRAACWGDNSGGQLGDGTNFSRPGAAGPFGLDGGLVDVAGGSAHTCVRGATGAVSCFGRPGPHLGPGGSGETLYSAVEPAGISSGVTSFAPGLGGAHVCAVQDAGVKCWGFNASGQLGSGTLLNARLPETASGLGMLVTSVGAGNEFACARLETTGVKCWGRNQFGQLGDGTTSDRSAPVDVATLASGVSALFVAKNRACAAHLDSTLRCWGYNLYGELGVGTSTAQTSPGTASGVAGATHVTFGENHTCARTSGGAVYCWGSGSAGQVGDDDLADNLSPALVYGLDGGVAAIAAGMYHTCALTSAGGVVCWGNNYYGQAGNGVTLTVERRPVDALGLTSGVAAIAAGDWHSCAVLQSGGVRCWGANSGGEVGDGTTVSQRASPAAVVAIDAGASLVAFGNETCAITAGGVLLCWGGGNATPSVVAGLSTDVVRVGLSGTNRCALTDAGAMRCWGSDLYGQSSGVFGGYPRVVSGVGP